MLETKIAQKIADEVMNTLGYNINVMNAFGIIIGSGNKERLGTYHDTAMRSIRDCKIYEVTESDCAHINGVQPGINMPIVAKNGDVLGAVGITGNPDEVRNIAKLVKMTAELIIEHQESINRLYRHRNDKELFVTTLLSARPAISEEEILEWGTRMGYDMALKRIACILIPEHRMKSVELEQILDNIKERPLHVKQDISVVMGDSSILIFKTIHNTEPWEIEAALDRYLGGLSGMVDDYGRFRAYIGHFYPGISGYRKSYEDAMLLYKENDAGGIWYSHLHLIRKLYRSLNIESVDQMLMPYIRRLSDFFGKGLNDAMITLQKLLSNGFHYEQAAEELYVHRNTVIFRKKKIDSCLDCDLRVDTNGLFLASLLVELYFDSSMMRRLS